MDFTFENHSLAVIDDFLEEELFHELMEDLPRVDFEWVHAKGWRKAFFPHNCDVLQSRVFAPSTTSPKKYSQFETEGAPAGSALDQFFHVLLENQEKLAPWIGKEGAAWDFVTGRFFIYPPGSGVTWHSDLIGRAGAFVLYLHPEWKPSWGGELVVSEVSVDLSSHRQTVCLPATQNPEIEKKNLKATHLSFFPVPNRLIVIKSGFIHQIKPVESAAGENLRLSLAGFFQNPSKEIPKHYIIQRFFSKSEP